MAYERSASITIRATTTQDRAGIDGLLAASYPTLLRADYCPQTLAACLPLITRAQNPLLTSGTYYLCETETGQPIAAGGWSHSAPQGGIGPRDVGHIRHVVTHPDAIRQGHARRILQRCFAGGKSSGIRWFICQSTRTAEPFYRKMGFQRRGEIDILLAPGIAFPAIEMIRSL